MGQMQTFETVALYNLTIVNDRELSDLEGQDFDPKAYSRMKHGVCSDTQGFASRLVSKLIAEMPDVVYDDEPPALVVAYELLPHAATVLASNCLDVINTGRTARKLIPGGLLRIFTSDYTVPYSAYSISDREALIGGQQGRVDTGSLEGKRPLIVDDICVTGTQTRWFQRVLREHTDKPLPAAYIASVDPEQARRFPEVEARLDVTDVKELCDLLPHIIRGDVVFIHKLLVDMLLASTSELEEFLDQLPVSLATEAAHKIRMQPGLQKKFPKNAGTIVGNANLAASSR